jgi:drug/metabolite transporter (DMT)-like permease
VSVGRAVVPVGAIGGIVMMLLGVLFFALNDTMGKWLLGTYAVGQLMLVRSISGLCVMVPAIHRVGLGGFRDAPRPGLQLVRAGFSTLEASLFFWGVSTLPLAEVMTYYMAGPIYVTALSPLLLGEQVGWRRWAAIAVGFCGVALALRPSLGSLSVGAVCALAGSFFYALFLVTTRKLAAVPGAVLMTGQLVSSLIFGAALVLAHGWTSTGPTDFALMLLLGIGSLLGNLCVNQSLRLAPATTVVPYQYTLILWGMLFGYAFFGEMIGPLTTVGAGTIVASGLFIFLREQQLGRRSKVNCAPSDPAIAKLHDLD